MGEHDMKDENRKELLLYPQNTEEPKNRGGKSPRRKALTRICSLVLSAALFGASASLAFYGVNRILPQTSVDAKAETSDAFAAASAVQTVSYHTATDQQSGTLDVSAIAEGAMPFMVSITGITVEQVQSYFGMFGHGGSATRQSESAGSGFLVGQSDTELLVVTNNHVIENADTLTVGFSDGTAASALVKGTDADNDIAVLSVSLSELSDGTKAVIKIAVLGDSDAVKVGQQVVAIGNALGYGQSVTTGIISATNRRISTGDAVMIQTDAAINPGNSGGALLNMNGEVIGINSAKYASTDVEGIGYAISISAAQPIIEELMNRTTREKISQENASYLGIAGQDVTEQIASTTGIPQGIYITTVKDQSPAAAAGLQKGDVLTGFDGNSITTLGALQKLLEYYAAGETVTLTVQRKDSNSYEEKNVTITLGFAQSTAVSSQY